MANFLALPDSLTTVEAWMSAVSALDQHKRRASNLVYSVTQPTRLDENGRRVIKAFDQFAIANGLHASDTVANTIFPLDTFRSLGPTEFYQFYIESVFPKVRKGWGTYFERMVRRKNDSGSPMIKDGKVLNPLANLISKAKQRVTRGLGTTTHYELALDDPAMDLALYDPHHDGAYQVGGPCLSHLSFKVSPDGKLKLTAFYRSHWYVARALGNLIGLARLQTFVATQVGAAVGPLTVVASEAVLDLTGGNRTAANTRTILKECADLLAS